MFCLKILLGVNIDHIAVLREARKVNSPNLIDALSVVEQAGADQITIHLREDRRHIQDEDVKNIIQNSVLPINLEISINSQIVDFTTEIKPHRATIVPEKREEVTTEGGLDIFSFYEDIENIIEDLQNSDIEVSLFIDPTIKNVKLAKKLNSDWVELHTGRFANLYAMLNTNISKTHHSIFEFEHLSRKELKKELNQSLRDLKESSKFAKSLGLKVAGGHGLNYQNIKLFTEVVEVEEVNIGQSIVARSIFIGLEKAILDMKELI